MTRENFEQTVKLVEFRVDIRKRHVVNTWVGVVTIKACSVFLYVFRTSQNFFRYVPVNDYWIFLQLLQLQPSKRTLAVIKFTKFLLHVLGHEYPSTGSQLS